MCSCADLSLRAGVPTAENPYNSISEMFTVDMRRFFRDILQNHSTKTRSRPVGRMQYAICARTKQASTYEYNLIRVTFSGDKSLLSHWHSD